MTGAESIDLARLALRSGEGKRLELELVVDGVELGGQSYAVMPQPLPAQLEISRTASGHAMRLTFSATVEGPCMRCLEPAAMAVDVESREVDQARATDEDLRSPYVDEQVLNAGAWAHDALALALPAQVLCRDDCAGLCPVCGGALNDAAPGAHDHPAEPDPRLAKLSELLDRDP